MELLYKPDWEETKKKYMAWWNGEVIGRCCIWVTSPKKNKENFKPPVAPSDPFKRWTDIEYIIELNNYTHQTTFYGGEAFPIWTGGYPGHTAIPTFLGCPIHLDETTGWWEPILNNDDWNIFNLKIDENNFWWNFTLKLLHTAKKEAKGKSIPSIGAFGASGDTLAGLRGSDKLLLDLYDRPEKVKEAEIYLMNMWIDVYNKFYEIIKDIAEGSTCWFPLWSNGKFYAVQNDFSYMISPKMFSEIFLPAIEKQINFLDHSIYHVDGVGSFVHLDILCKIPKLNAIQIHPGAGKPSPLYYMDILKKVQKSGKNLHITIPANQVETALENLSAKGLFIATSCESEEEAKELLKKCEKWSKDRKFV